MAFLKRKSVNQFPHLHSKESLGHFTKQVILCAKDERKHTVLEQWVNEDNILISGWTYPFELLKVSLQATERDKIMSIMVNNENLPIYNFIQLLYNFHSKNNHTLTATWQVPLRQVQFTQLYNYIIYNHEGTAGLESFS